MPTSPRRLPTGRESIIARFPVGCENRNMATFADDDAALWMDVTQQMKVKGLTSVSAFRVMDRDRGAR
ncbi:hypothetical protein JL720_4976 [Aureococcus anophagefferens]|nr:hypothetical protein JL720_4976 [Aureococcus anophagefferens]